MIWLRLSLQAKLSIWLLILVFPIVAASVLSVRLIEDRLTERVYSALLNDHRLEQSRIEAALDRYQQYARNLSYSPELRALVERVRARQQISREQASPEPVDPVVIAQEIQTVVDLMKSKAQLLNATDTDIMFSTVVGRHHAFTSSFEQQSDHWELFEQAANAKKITIGKGFRNRFGIEKIIMAVPVFVASSLSPTPVSQTPLSPIPVSQTPVSSSAELAGVLLVKTNLGPIVDLVVAHERLGESSEAHVAQSTNEGDAQFITPLRFERDAAFNKIVPIEKNLPINWSLLSEERRVLRSPDYRSVDSILAIGQIPGTGWGLVVKIDAREAFIALEEVKRIVWYSAIACVVLVLISWPILVRPLAKRLKTASLAADRLAKGDYQNLINDPVPDEIGVLSSGIDRLASDLDRDRSLRKLAEQKLIYQAEHDEVTGLFNRKYLLGRIQNLDRHSRDLSHSTLFLDLDRFKEINDRHGHHVGDELLAEVASELSNIIDDSYYIGRWGGDEFVVIMPETDEQIAVDLAMRISVRFDKPFKTSAGYQSVGCSVGVGTTSDETSLDATVKIADKKMYEAKKAVKNANARISQAIDFVTASLDEKRIEVWYQPIVEADTPTGWIINGVEALLRIRDENGELVPPNNYLPYIVESGLSTELDLRVLEKVFQDLANWKESKLVNSDFYLSVNLSGTALRLVSLPSFIQKLLIDHQVPPKCIVIEVTEKMHRIDFDVLLAVKALGLRFAIDDLGLRRSNLSRLSQLAPVIAKIDSYWVPSQDDFETSDTLWRRANKKSVVLDHMLDTCKQMRMQCVVKGIENDAQIEQLKAMGVTRYQGYIFDQALPDKDFTDKLRQLPECSNVLERIMSWKKSCIVSLPYDVDAAPSYNASADHETDNEFVIDTQEKNAKLK